VAGPNPTKMAWISGILLVTLVVGLVIFESSKNQSRDLGATTSGAASLASFSAAHQSCSSAELQLQRQYGESVRLVASYPTDLRDAWNWANPSSNPVDRAPSRWRLVSAKLCLFDGPFREGPSFGGFPNHEVNQSQLPVLPKLAEILAPNGLGDGVDLHAWPHEAVPLRNLRAYSGRVTHWPPW
jgi:hypothetical protein